MGTTLSPCRRALLPAALCVVLSAIPARAQVEGTPAALRVSPQGLLTEVTDPAVRTSPAGSLRVQVLPEVGDFHHFESTLRVTARGGSVHVLPSVAANGFLATDAGRVVAIDAVASRAAQSRLSLLGLDGRELWSREVRALSDPTLSADGTYLAYRSERGIVTLDLVSFEEAQHPNLAHFAVDGGGRLAGIAAAPGTGEVVLRTNPDTAFVARVDGRPRRIAFAADGRGLLVLTAHALVGVDPRTAETRTLWRAPEGSELRDLRVRADGVHLGLRRFAGTAASGLVSGSHVQLATGSATVVSATGQTPVPARDPWDLAPLGQLPWPLAPNGQHPVGNTYGEYQNYGGSPYMHPGVDVLGSGGQPVYAVKQGVVKAVLTTSGQFHWRVATGAPGGGTSTGFLYAHLDPATIAVNVGDTVQAGQYLGDLVPWPVAGFTHVHFARIEDSGAQWFGDWLCTDDPQHELANQSETERPVFENAVGTSLFAFATNETASYQSPAALTGAVDIVVHVGDRIASSWTCAVHEIRYSIWPVGAPQSPVVDDRLALRFDMPLDTYQNGPTDPFLVGLLYQEDATCNTDGDYSSREFFHVITNSDGDESYTPADLQEAWDTTQLPNGDYVVEVTATDAAGNAAVASMTVTTANP